LAQQPTLAIQQEWLKELRPYLRFTAREI
jgi:hypothetical protein